MCIHGEVRLYGGYTENYGIAEVCIHGVWAYICDNVDRTTVAKIFCRQLMGDQFSKLYTPLVTTHG